MSSAVRPRRVNGLAPPYTAAQISTWIFLPLLVLEFCFFVSPLLPLAASISCTLAFGCFAISSAVFGFLAMKVDPKDPRLPNENNVTTTTTTAPTYDPEEPTKQCWICDVQVGEKSMHCKFCNKCVDHFDHHCMWLNTCVGRANYHYFFRCMVSIAIMLVIQAVIQLALILEIYLGSGATKERAEGWFQADATIAVVVVMAIFLFFNLGSLSLIGQLLLFHIRLQRNGLSTYQYIVRDNQQRREKARMEDELTMRREMAIAHAKNEGKGCLSLRLEANGILRKQCGVTCCDPLKTEEEGKEAEMAPHSGGNGFSNGDGQALTISNGDEDDDGIDDESKETENV
ncbi:DHHC palmitoyltransferase [Nitzschia inconspicua]|uniref:Palmitoyltransferase n=1 Tax=Nitzschia inconspicua TaxID=303405 RepID=A0A9K3KQ25_9STRA|nr:DHHC palmitoyltransferase [Nitzschia inconspicua]